MMIIHEQDDRELLHLSISYTNRKRAKDLTLAISLMMAKKDEADYQIKVEVVSLNLTDYYIVTCEYPPYLKDEIEAMTILGNAISDGWQEDAVIKETYAGEGLSRFRGNS